MRRMMIFGAAIAVLLMCDISVDAGCGSGGAGLFAGIRARHEARQQARAMSYAAGATACSAGAASCSTGMSYSTYQSVSASAPVTYQTTCTTGTCAYPPATAVAPATVQYVYVKPVTASGQTCDANGDGCCDHCGQNCKPAPPATVTPPIPPPAPPGLGSRSNIKKKIAASFPTPLAPPIAYTPPPSASGDTLVAFR